MQQALQQLIDQAWENRAPLSPTSAEPQIREAVDAVIARLDRGELRVAEKIAGRWQTHQWIKKAVLLSFRLQDNHVMPGACTQYYDKVPSKFAGYTAADFVAGGFRVVPPRGAPGAAPSWPATSCSCLPTSTSVPTSTRARWSTPGPRSAPARRSARTCTSRAASASAECWSRCRPIPRSSRTTASSARAPRSWRASSSRRTRCSRWGCSSARAPASTTGPTGETLYGRVPAGSVVVPGTLPAPDGHYALSCAVIVKQVDAKTRAKTSINELLRGD